MANGRPTGIAGKLFKAVSILQYIRIHQRMIMSAKLNELIFVFFKKETISTTIS